MPRELKFQDPGEGIHEGEIADILVSVGDEVREGDDLLVVETDKATTELPSTHSGKIEKIHVSKGDVVEVGDVLVSFANGEDEGGEDKDDESHAATKSKERESSKEKSQDGGKSKMGKSEGGKAAAVGELPGFEDAEEKKKSTGDETQPQDKHTKPKPERKPREKAQEQKADGQQSERPVPASPATRRLARELQIDLREVEPSGPHGRVIDDDVRQAAEKQGSENQAAEEQPSEEEKQTSQTNEPSAGRRKTATPSRERPELPDFERWGPVEREPLKGIRRQTAHRMSLSWQEIPHVTHHDWIDVTELERWRREHAGKVEEKGGQLSLMVLVIK